MWSLYSLLAVLACAAGAVRGEGAGAGGRLAWGGAGLGRLAARRLAQFDGDGFQAAESFNLGGGAVEKKPGGLHDTIKHERKTAADKLQKAAEGTGATARIAQRIIESKGKGGAELFITSGFRYEKTRARLGHRVAHQHKYGAPELLGGPTSGDDFRARHAEKERRMRMGVPPAPELQIIDADANNNHIV